MAVWRLLQDTSRSATASGASDVVSTRRIALLAIRAIVDVLLQEEEAK